MPSGGSPSSASPPHALSSIRGSSLARSEANLPGPRLAATGPWPASTAGRPKGLEPYRRQQKAGVTYSPPQTATPLDPATPPPAVSGLHSAGPVQTSFLGPVRSPGLPGHSFRRRRHFRADNRRRSPVSPSSYSELQRR